MYIKYTAKNKDGGIEESVVEAEDKFALARNFRAKGYQVFSARELTSKKININLFGGGMKTSELILFTKNLASMLKAGLSLSRALSVLEKQNKKQTIVETLKSLADNINQGGTLSEAMAKSPKIFSKLFVSMVRAGEESGNLAGALTEVGNNLEKSHNLTRKIKGALIYPGVIFSAMIIIAILMFAFVVPTLASTFESFGAALPASTQFIISLGDFFSKNLLLSFGVLFSFVGLIYYLIRLPVLQPYFDAIILRLPAVGQMAKDLNTARTARTISSLLLSGVSITRSVQITEDVVQNYYYKKVLEQAVYDIEKGTPFSKIFEANSKIYPVMMAEMVQVGEETGNLTDMLSQIAAYYEDEIDNKTKNLSTIIEPVLMIVIGAGVGFFAISMISPIYSILSNVS